MHTGGLHQSRWPYRCRSSFRYFRGYSGGGGRALALASSYRTPFLFTRLIGVRPTVRAILAVCGITVVLSMGITACMRTTTRTPAYRALTTTASTHKLQQAYVGDAVASTARWIAAARARESERHDAVFVDRFAAALAGEEGFAFRDGQAPIAVSRTKFMDDFVLDACRRGATQVVNLGAGMDTRAVRLPFPRGVTVYELDKPELFRVKEPILETMLRPDERALCTRRVVPVNFDANESWVEKLVEAGFDRSAKAVFVLEGLTYYLSQKENEVVFAGAASVAAPGSSLVLDMVNGDFMREQNSWHLQDLRERGCGWLWGSNDPEGVLASHGFAATVFDLDHLSVVRSRGVGKPPSIRAVPSPRGRIHGGGPRTFYVTAVKSAAVA